MPSIPRCGGTEATFDRGTTVEKVVGHEAWRALVPEMVAICAGTKLHRAFKMNVCSVERTPEHLSEILAKCRG